jgi:hypothetical protein
VLEIELSLGIIAFKIQSEVVSRKAEGEEGLRKGLLPRFGFEVVLLERNDDQ